MSRNTQELMLKGVNQVPLAKQLGGALTISDWRLKLCFVKMYFHWQ